MKKAICLMIVLAIFVCAFAGCGKNKHTETGPQVIKTFELKDEKITAENVSPYEGKYLEYGDAENISGIYAMKFTNTSSKTIQSALLVFSDGTHELSFWLEMLPAGKSVIVAEQNQLTVSAEQLEYVDGTITYLEDSLENMDCVQVTDNKDGSVQIKNITKKPLPLVRVFYRPADEDGTPIGGPCQSIMVDGIEVGAAVNVPADGWDDSSVVVTVLVVNE